MRCIYHPINIIIENMSVFKKCRYFVLYSIKEVTPAGNQGTQMDSKEIMIFAAFYVNYGSNRLCWTNQMPTVQENGLWPSVHNKVKSRGCVLSTPFVEDFNIV